MRPADGPDPDPIPPDPAAAGEDRISALPRGPRSVCLYWELNGPRSAGVLGPEHSGVELILRVLDLSEGTSRSIRVDAGDGSCYASVEGGRTYGFELAVRAEGVWRTLCRTGRVQTPAAVPGQPPAARMPLGDPARVRRTRTLAAVRGMDVPGLDYESTPLNLGASPVGWPPGDSPSAGPAGEPHERT